MSEYQLESNLEIGTELDNSNFDDYGVDNCTENLNSNMSSNIDGTNNFTNLSQEYMSNDSIRQYQKKKIEGFDSENIKF